MSKLYFTYSAMNAGKSAILLQAAHNYGERGMKVMLWTSEHHAESAEAESGEIESRIDGLGHSRVWESRYPGVWLVEHKNPGEERISLQIEIAEVPEILKAQKADIRDGLENLSEKLSTEGL